MPLFSRKKQSDDSEKPSTNRKNSVSLTCPECGFEQTESSMALSTYCRGCSTHYKISEGKAVPKKSRPSNPFASLEKTNLKPKLRKPSDTTQKPEKAATRKSKPESTNKPQPHAPSASAQNQPERAAPINRLFQAKPSSRQVACFECEKVHKAPAEASSTLCPACGAYIGLKNYDIRDNWNRRIQTRGDVIIHKKAAVTGITIRCHDLTVIGTLTGGVDCSGDFIIQNHGKIMGKVQCKRLIIEKRAHVEFSNPVTCEDAIIDGEVTGNFTCTGKLHLKKKATLNGDIKVATMAVDEGARHQGRISIGQ